MLLRNITTRVLKVVEMWLNSNTYMGVCQMCMLYFKCSSVIIFVLLNVLAWLFTLFASPPTDPTLHLSQSPASNR